MSSARACWCWMLLSLVPLSGSAAEPTADARPENLVAANAAAVQAALDSLPPEGGCVRIGPGTIELTEPLRIHGEDVLFEGSGTATHLQNKNTQGQPALLISHPECRVAKTDRKFQLWRIRVANLRITGNEQSGAGIEARQINEIFLQGVTVSQNGGDGILLDHCYEDPRVSDCLITYNKKTGLNLQGCHDIVVSSNQFEENQDALLCADGFNLCMNGNNLDDHLRHGVVIENTYGSVLSGNMIEECEGTAIILDRDCYGITLSANVIAHNGAGIDLRDAHGCAVSANTLTINKTASLRIGPESGRITVTANNFSNSFVGRAAVQRAPNDWAAGGLLIEGASHVAVTGNVFSGLTEKALTLVGETQGILFQNNIVVDAETDTPNP